MFKVNDLGTNNAVAGRPKVVNGDVEVGFRGSNNKLFIGPNVTLDSTTILFRGSDQTVRFMGNNRIRGHFALSGNGASMVINIGSRCNGQMFVNLGELEDSLRIGKDCLFANCSFRTSDSHPIYDKTTGERLNPSKSIIVGDNVWIAEGALILKGVVIGSGSVVGARSLVTSSLPGDSLCAGAPAKVIRSNIRWSE